MIELMHVMFRVLSLYFYPMAYGHLNAGCVTMQNEWKWEKYPQTKAMFPTMAN